MSIFLVLKLTICLVIFVNTQPDVVQSWGIDPKSVKTIKDGLQFRIVVGRNGLARCKNLGQPTRGRPASH